MAAWVLAALLGLTAAQDPQEGQPCSSSAYADAWGRSSPDGTLALCRVPAVSADVESLEYELRAGGVLLWRCRLPHALEEAVVSDSGAVAGFAIQDDPRSASLAHVVTISRHGRIEREWRLGARTKWISCNGEEPAVTEIARVDASRIAVRTGYDD